ncbi:MAG: uracil-DNA glycosylase, partial [Hyphomicrobiales bacterium]
MECSTTVTGARPENDELDLLRWYAEMGVDEAIGDEPVDRYAESAAQAKRAAEAREKPRAAPETPPARARSAPRAPAAAP